jgi:hypothetical protein
LSDTQAKRRLGEYGKNAPSPPKTNRLLTIFGYFFKGFGGILLVGSILVFVSWKPLGQPPQLANLVRERKSNTLLLLLLFLAEYMMLTALGGTGLGNCSSCSFLYPGRLHHVPGLVNIASHVIHQRHASRAVPCY